MNTPISGIEYILTEKESEKVYRKGWRAVFQSSEMIEWYNPLGEFSGFYYYNQIPIQLYNLLKWKLPNKIAPHLK